MSWQFDDKSLLNCLFSNFLPFSLDLQRLISDYLFLRETITFEKDGKPSWLRFGPMAVGDQVAYEIRAYNEKECQVFSTFEMGANFILNYAFRNFQEIIKKNEHWHDIFLSRGEWYRFRYVFSPVTKHTYTIVIKESRIDIYRRTVWGGSIDIGYVKWTQNENIIECLRMIEQYGEEWDFCQKDTYLKGNKILKNAKTILI